MERRLLGAPVPVERITYHAHSAPLHKIKTDNMLPSQLLTPFQVSSSASCTLGILLHLCLREGRLWSHLVCVHALVAAVHTGSSL